MHEAQQRPHVVVTAGRQDELLDDEQGVLPTLAVLHDVVDAASAAKLSEQSWGREKETEQRYQSLDETQQINYINQLLSVVLAALMSPHNQHEVIFREITPNYLRPSIQLLDILQTVCAVKSIIFTLKHNDTFLFHNLLLSTHPLPFFFQLSYSLDLSFFVIYKRQRNFPTVSLRQVGS